MKSLIRWSIGNAPGMNTLMIAVLFVGCASLAMMRREVFPEFELDIVLITVPYPGASPDEVEEGICQKIEESVRAIDGIKKLTAIARESSGFIVLELNEGVDSQKILNEVRSEIDAIPSFPVLAEDAKVTQVTFRVPAIRVGVISHETDTPDAENRLRKMAERVRDELLELPSISQAEIMGARQFQIDIEIPETVLRKHGLTLQQVAQIVRRENIEVPGGSMKTNGDEVLLRGKNKRQVGDKIANIPILTQSNGDVLTLRDLGNVYDGFSDTTAISEIDGRSGLAISVNRTSTEDLLKMAEEVKKFAREKKLEGYELVTWFDQSVDVADRMYMLIRNGWTGLAFVFIVLAVFLELRLAFWVALGIPVAILGAGGILLYFGQTLNMLTMFAFLMALGIVVDDAIVIGENIYGHREMGKDFITSAIDGTIEVLPSVCASVTTTIIAFMPLMFVSGVMGKFIAVMPLAVIAMLVISLLESTFILPCHLSHQDGVLFRVIGFVFAPFKWVALFFRQTNRASEWCLRMTVEKAYLPVLRGCLAYPAIPLSFAIALLTASGGFVAAGITPWVLFPKMDNRWMEASIQYPNGTPSKLTDKATMALEAAALQVNREFKDQFSKSMFKVRQRMVGLVGSPGTARPGEDSTGSHVGAVTIELIPPSERDVVSQKMLERWREIWLEKYQKQFPGAESIRFGSPQMGPAGTPIEFKLLAPANPEDFHKLELAVEACKAKLAKYEGVFDIDDDSHPGKWEYQIRIKDQALAMGVTLADVAETIRASYYGDEVMRLQRGRHEVKLMVRYPRNERHSLAAFDKIRVRTGNGSERPLTELANIEVKRGYTEINRVDQMRSITISADVKEGVANAQQVVADLRKEFMPELLKKYPTLRVRWEGQQEQSRESMISLVIGFGIALLAMFILLTLEFRSYFQPLLILFIIPFGAIGAIAGHAVMGMDLTMFSMFGLVALTGVIVNDSIVLIDFMNTRVRAGVPINEALIDAGRRRFRPVVLTSITTVAGLTPMMLETSFQAQVLIPMATSMCFGLALATTLILVLVPTCYSVYHNLSSSSLGVTEP